MTGARTEIAVPTPERLIAANDNFVVDRETGATRMQDSPLDRLLRIGAITGLQHTAGTRYFADYFAAGLAPLGAFDYMRPVVDGASPKGDSDYRVGAVQRWNGARGAMGAFFSAVVDPVVLAERSLDDAGRALGLGNRPQAVAVAKDRLCGGLDILIERYGLRTKKSP